MSELPGSFATEKVEDASCLRLSGVRSTYDIIQSGIFPVDDLDGPARVHVTLVSRQVPVNQVLPMKVRHSVGDVGAEQVAN